jgi:hypothetical protein
MGRHEKNEQVLPTGPFDNLESLYKGLQKTL